MAINTYTPNGATWTATVPIPTGRTANGSRGDQITYANISACEQALADRAEYLKRVWPVTSVYQATGSPLWQGTAVNVNSDNGASVHLDVPSVIVGDVFHVEVNLSWVPSTSTADTTNPFSIYVNAVDDVNGAAIDTSIPGMRAATNESSPGVQFVCAQSMAGVWTVAHAGTTRFRLFLHTTGGGDTANVYALTISATKYSAL